jgi:oxygen-independent coproporphyrinogen-3 oxidase
MSGIYFHFPFCLKKCRYCDFYTVIGTEIKEAYIHALIKEIKIRKNYLNGDRIGTIYFGGGTPGLMNAREINSVLDETAKQYTFENDVEISIELNPDDVDRAYVEELKKTPVNRISLGIQSFFDDDLKLMNRRHSTKQSSEAISFLQDAGYVNISGDLIYGLPGMTLAKWNQNLDLFFNTGLVHLSAYHLTYEPKTVFYKYLQTGKLKELDEETSLLMFNSLIEKAERNKMIWYETSNFGKEGYFSKHNSGYWQQKKYLGLGPSAHSFDGESRQFNPGDLKGYIEAMNAEAPFFEREILSKADRYNDYILTSLRTVWGADLRYINEHMGPSFYDFIIRNLKPQIENGYLTREDERIYLTRKGKFIENTIIEKLFYC